MHGDTEDPGGMDHPQAATEFPAGSRVGGYLLEEQIGHGGMAVVFRALDEKLGRRVALKILTPPLASDATFRQRFIRESRAAAAVDDPHIIPVYEAGESAGVLFIAMRYVPGGDVRSLLAGAGPLEAARVAAIVSPVASALDAAHAAGLVHRDVKPANMLLDMRPGRPEHVYLSDFGLSKETAGSGSLTGTGLFLGTVDYAAPEQISGREVSGPADQYALACAAFEMLSGQPPFVRDHSLAVLHAHLSAAPPQASTMRPGLSPAVDAVLSRALAKAPEDRYRTCGEFSDALRGALSAAPYDPGSRSLGHPPTELASNMMRSAPAGSGGAAEMTVRSSADPADGTGGSARGQVSGSGCGPARRWPLVVLSGAAAIAVAAAVILIASRADGTGAGPPAGHSRAPATGPASSSPTGLRWTTYRDSSGFSVGLPDGWAVDSAARTGAYPSVDFAGPRPGFRLVISWTTSATGIRALPAWRRQAATFARNDSTYQLIGLRQVSYRRYNSAIWEFTNVHDGVLTRVLDLGIVVRPGIEGYAIELYGPQADWPAVYDSIWNRVLASFKPRA
jgi:serine/threonine protein kinase